MKHKMKLCEVFECACVRAHLICKVETFLPKIRAHIFSMASSKTLKIEYSFLDQPNELFQFGLKAAILSSAKTILVPM